MSHPSPTLGPPPGDNRHWSSTQTKNQKASKGRGVRTASSDRGQGNEYFKATSVPKHRPPGQA